MIGITGATGFVGRALTAWAELNKTQVRPLLRNELGDLGQEPINSVIFQGCTAIIHAAARAHRMNDHGLAALAAYRQANVAGTQAIITAMEKIGVRRLVYVSSIKAIGERSYRGTVLSPKDPRHPEDCYGMSKAEAEDVVTAAHIAGRIEAVIVRPVLVHGPGAKGNLERLMQAVLNERRLPFGCVQNRRSLVGISNLTDALITAATKSLPSRINTKDNKIISLAYHIADDGVISTRRLVEVLAEGMGVRPRFINVPRWLAVGGATLLGKGAMARRIFDDLEVDASAFTNDTGWQPKKSLEDGLREMAVAYAQQHRVGGFA